MLIVVRSRKLWNCAREHGIDQQHREAERHRQRRAFLPDLSRLARVIEDPVTS
jgi:hypothetical protein